MKLAGHKLTAELMILLCMITLKVVDLKTDCVGTTLGAVKQASETLLPSELSHVELWDSFGALGQIDRRQGAPGVGSRMSDTPAFPADAEGPGTHLNFGSAHYRLAQAGLWTWTKGSKYGD
jgi:hypothetical protein